MRSRPTPAQIKTVVSFVEKHPEIAWKELRNVDTGFDKVKRLWDALAKIVNSIDGARKSSSSWMKFWQDKRRNVVVKSRLIKQGKLERTLTSVERRIMKLHLLRRKNRIIKSEPRNGDNKSVDGKNEGPNKDAMVTNDFEEKSWNLMETMIEVMGKQGEALTQIGRESLKKSEAMEQIAKASYRQALAVDKLATIFDGFSGSLYEVRNAIMSIDYTMKRCYPPAPHHRHIPILFS